MGEEIWRLHEGGGPLIATAIHDGHQLRSEVASLMVISDEDRLREEDPFTSLWTEMAGTQVVARRSRFEVDLNRSRDKAVYLTPEDAWGLTVWKQRPGDEIVQRSLEGYDRFYSAMQKLLTDIARTHGVFVVFDLHSYNHRRAGVNGPAASETDNPQINVGTGTMDRQKWAPVVDRFMAELRGFDFPGGRLDVRENVKFRGGNFVRWIHDSFPENGCGLAIEVKKFFMDEWTGVEDVQVVASLGKALRATVPGIHEELNKIR